MDKIISMTELAKPVNKFKVTVWNWWSLDHVRGSIRSKLKAKLKGIDDGQKTTPQKGENQLKLAFLNSQSGVFIRRQSTIGAFIFNLGAEDVSIRPKRIIVKTNKYYK